MFSKLNNQSRIWILLIAWILFTALCVADTFDLSDDIVLPTAAGQAAVAPDAMEDQKPHAFALEVFLRRSEFESLWPRLRSAHPALFSMPFTCSDTTLYHRHSVYRI